MKNFKFWIKLCVFNFFIVSTIGVMMRYNIAFSSLSLNHTFMQESHSHFAFYGWVSACIYLFITNYLHQFSRKINLKKYQILMIFNQISSYGMLITFLFYGYNWMSIIFSSIALFTSFAYFILLLIDTKSSENPEIIWLRSGAFFATFSSIGIFFLAYFASRKIVDENFKNAYIYFYLHYQYNGFFLFSCIGLFIINLQQKKIYIPERLNKIIFYLLFVGSLFGFGLSVLWMKIPSYLHTFLIVIAIAQLFGALKLGLWVWNNRLKVFTNYCIIKKTLVNIFGFVFLMKFILQYLSTIPDFGIYAFNNVNIVIAYLHLVLLMGISLFLVWKIVEIKTIIMGKSLRISIFTMIFGIVLNEIILVLAGFPPICKVIFFQPSYGLFIASVIIMISIMLFFSSLNFSHER